MYHGNPHRSVIARYRKSNEPKFSKLQSVCFHCVQLKKGPLFSRGFVLVTFQKLLLPLEKQVLWFSDFRLELHEKGTNSRFHNFDTKKLSNKLSFRTEQSMSTPKRRFTRRADRRLPPGCYGNLIVNVKRGQSRPKTCLWGRPRQTRLGHVHVHGCRRGTFLLY